MAKIRAWNKKVSWDKKTIVKLLKKLSDSPKEYLSKSQIKTKMKLSKDYCDILIDYCCITQKFIKQIMIQEGGEDVATDYYTLDNEGREYLERYEEKQRAKQGEHALLVLYAATVVILLYTALIYRDIYEDNQDLTEHQIAINQPWVVPVGTIKCPENYHQGVRVSLSSIGRSSTVYNIRVTGNDMLCSLDKQKNEYTNPCSVTRSIGTSNNEYLTYVDIELPEKRPRRFSYNISYCYQIYDKSKSEIKWTDYYYIGSCVYDSTQKYGVYKLNMTHSS